MLFPNNITFILTKTYFTDLSINTLANIFSELCLFPCAFDLIAKYIYKNKKCLAVKVAYSLDWGKSIDFEVDIAISLMLRVRKYDSSVQLMREITDLTICTMLDKCHKKGHVKEAMYHAHIIPDSP